MEAVRVLLVDDHPVFAEALAVRLSGEPDLEVLSIAHTVAEALTRLAHDRPTVAVLDLVLGMESGLAVLDHVRAAYPDVKVVMLSAVDNVDAVVEAIRRGAKAWLPKSADVAELVQAIHGVVRGEAHVPPSLLGPVLALLAESRPPDPDALAVLTVREREVLQCMVDGLSRSQIAQRLRLSTNTVRTHAQNLLVKIGGHSVLEAVAIAQRAGMRQSG